MRVYCLDGIGTQGRVDGSILAHTADRLGDHLKVTPEWIPWEAAMLGIGGPGSWDDNARAGVGLLASRMDSHDDDVILLGYSGGCKVVHDFLDTHPALLSRVTAVGLLSDPWRPGARFQHGTPRPIGYGIMGERLGPIPGRTFWSSTRDDVISAAWPDALLRHVADVSEGSVDDIIRRAIHIGGLGQFQLFWQLGVIQREPFTWMFGMPGRIGQLSADVRGYLTGRHTTDYIIPYETHGGDDRSLAVRLADTIAWAVQAQ